MHHPPPPRDPLLPLDSRWRAARACVEQGRPPAACDDLWVSEAARFLAERGDRPGPGALARPAEKMPAVAQAFDLRQADPPHLRWAVEARLLAGESFGAIGRKCGLLPEAVELYERLFFAVADMLGFDTWVMCQAVGPRAYSLSERDVDVWWKLLGYCFGPLMLDKVIDHSAGLPRPAEDGQLAAALDHGAEALFRAKKLLAANLLVVTPETAPQVLQLAAQLEAAGDPPADGAAPQQGTAECLLGGLAAPPGAAEGGTGPPPQAAGPIDPPGGQDELSEGTGPEAGGVGSGLPGRPGPAHPTSRRARRVAV